MRVQRFCLLLVLLFSACAPKEPGPAVLRPQGAVVRGVAVIPLALGGGGEVQAAQVIGPADSKFTLDTGQIVIPPIANSLLYFGKLAISELKEDNLNVCGTNGKTKCGRLYIQMYTTGTPGSGAWNSAGGYGMPIYTNLTNSHRLTVGLGQSAAAVVQIVTIATNKNNIQLSDFSVKPEYEMRTDFTEAGAGTYATTLVVEYGLAL